MTTSSKPVPPGTPPPSPPPPGPTHPTPTGPGPGRASFSLAYALPIAERLLADAHAVLTAVETPAVAVAEFRAGAATLAVRELADRAGVSLELPRHPQTPGSVEADAAPLAGPGFHLPRPPGPPSFERARRIGVGTRARAVRP